MISASEENPILSDVRRYRAERVQGWDYILRRFDYAVTNGGAYVTNDWQRVTSQLYIKPARLVLSRLASAGGAS